jgi:hypothetical protein
MNDLHDLLERVSTPAHDWLADPSALLHEGRRRVRRRRVAVSAVSCVAALAVGGVTVAQLGGSSPDAVGPSGPTTYADLDLTPLSNAEVEQRCVSAVKLMDQNAPTDFVIPDSILQPNPGIKPDGKDYQTPKPWHTGTRVLAMPRTKAEWHFYGEPTGCTIPEAGRTAQAFTRVGTTSQLQGDCGDNLGIDLSAWQQLTASSDDKNAVALYRSGNDFIVYCYVYGSGSLGIQGQAFVMQEDAPKTSTDRWTPGAQCWQTEDHDTYCFGDGRVDDPAATRVDVTLPSGRSVRTDAVDGYWSVAVRDDASGRWRAKPGDTFETSPVQDGD